MSATNEQTCRAAFLDSARNGGCNFCTRNTERMVWVVKSNDEHRHLEVRFCDKCMKELMEQARKK